MERQVQPEYESKAEFFVRHTETGEIININDSSYETLDGVLRPGIYRHYKSKPDDLKFYLVERAVKQSDSGEILAIYRLLDSTDEAVFARPLEIFRSSVKVGRGEIPRFRYIGPEL